MATEYTIFEKFIGKQDHNDAIFIRMTSESDTELYNIDVRDVTITEGLSIGSPVAVINFIDGNGDLINHNRLDTSAVYKLHIGTVPEEAKVIPLKISKIAAENHVIGKSENFVFQVFFVHESWERMMNLTHSRGWANTKISEIVKGIAQEIGAKSISVSDTATVHESLVQPHWSNLTYLKWLAERSDCPDPKRSGHFEFGLTMTGDFFFMSIPALIEKSINQSDVYARRQKNRDTIPVFKLDGNPTNQKERQQLVEKNGYIPASFTSFGISEDFMVSIIQGAGGVTGMYYDFEAGTFNSRNHTFSGSYNTQLSEWAMIHNDNELSHLNIYNGRDTTTPIVANNRVSSVTSSIQKFRIQCDGTPYISIGDIVEVLIPTPVDKSNIPYNEFYSGFYFVSDVNHQFILNGNTTYRTVITLSRQGVDGKGVTGFIKSKAGRARFNNV